MSEENEVLEEVSESVNTEVDAEDSTPSDDSNELDGQESEDSEATEESEPTEAKKKSGFQKRIDELTRQRYEAEQRAQQLEDRLSKQQQEMSQIGHQTQKPTLEQFNYDEQSWAQAMESWAEQGIQRQQEIQQQAEQQRTEMSRQAEIGRKIQEQTVKAIEKYPDFHQKVNNPSLPSIQSVSPAAYEALITSENMGEVAYYLANNPAEVYQLGSMSPLDAVRAITRLEAKLSYTAPKPTQAPKPPSSVKGKSDAVTDLDRLPMKDWMNKRNEQIKR